MRILISLLVFLSLLNCRSAERLSEVGTQATAYIKPGTCGTKDDCPPPYNTCSANGECSYTAPSTPIWFLTDQIWPGVSSNSVNGISDYAYNIMAKGKSSLDDWCMSQAQLVSTTGAKTIREIKKWQAYIIAANDSYSSVISTAAVGSRGRIGNIMNEIYDTRYFNNTNMALVDTLAMQRSQQPTLSDRSGNPIDDGYVWFGVYSLVNTVNSDICNKCGTNACPGGNVPYPIVATNEGATETSAGILWNQSTGLAYAFGIGNVGCFTDNQPSALNVGLVTWDASTGASILCSSTVVPD